MENVQNSPEKALLRENQLLKEKIATLEQSVSSPPAEALRQSQAMLKSIFRSAPTGIGVVKNRVLTWTNERLSQITGYGADELLNQSSRLLYPSDEDFEYVGREKYRQIQATGTGTVETHWKRKDGSLIDVLLSSTPIDPEDHSVGVTFTALDITERKRMESERTRLAIALEQAAEDIIMTSPEGVIEYVNPAFERITGYSREEVLGQNPRFLKSGEQGDPFYQHLWNTITHGNIWRGRFINRCKNGELIHVDAVISPVKDPQGNITNFVAVKRDITEQIHLENQLRQSQKMEAIGQFAGGIAHDFNNILQVILGFSEFAIQDLESGHPVQENLSEIKEAATRADSLVRQLLTFSRTEITRPEDLRLDHLIKGWMKMLDRMIGGHIEVVFQQEESLGLIHADPGHIHQVLLNLCINARDAMPTGGTIHLTTKNTELDESFAQNNPWARAGSFVQLEVSDSGQGMPPKVLNRVFEPFFTTKAPGEGTGLGLATVYGIVKQSKGLIQVRSAPGKGTAFNLYFPRVGPGSSPTVKPATEERAEGGTETLLIAEDDAQVRLYAATLLQKAGYHVTDAANGAAALEQFKQNPERFDLVILDMIMPRMNGYEVADQIRQIRPEIPLLFASGFTGNNPEPQLLKRENAEFVSKPYSARSLLGRIRRLLNATPSGPSD